VSDQDAFATTRSVVVSRLRDEILSGRLPYGTRLRQAEFAKRFGISTTPVREAFRELATLGLVEIHPHRGAIVLRPSTEELAHIYQVRMLIEPVSVAWSAQRITAAGLAEARSLLAAMREPITADRSAALNRRFHALIARACGNNHLSELVINLLDLSTPYVVRILQSSAEQADRQAAEHEAILRACQRQDPAAAYQASLHHLTRLHLDGGDSALAAVAERWLPFDLKAWLAADMSAALTRGPEEASAPGTVTGHPQLTRDEA
jgi:DNA-binding GntR family transcriptional regulator